MRRPASLATAALVVMLALTLAPVTRADDRDPRCAGWARHGAPPGTDMAVMCPDTPLGLDGISLGDEPLVPYIVGLLVMAGVLTVFGFVAMRVLARPPSKGRDAEWWTCSACGETNRPERGSCFACHASRSEAAHPA